MNKLMVWLTNKRQSYKRNHGRFEATTSSQLGALQEGEQNPLKPSWQCCMLTEKLVSCFVAQTGLSGHFSYQEVRISGFTGTVKVGPVLLSVLEQPCRTRVQ